MLSRSERETILAEGVAGIPRVAQRIGALSAAQQVKALDAAKQSYLKTLHDLGYGAGAAQKWVTTVMVQLRMTMRAEALLEHDPAKWKPVFRKDHAPSKC